MEDLAENPTFLVSLVVVPLLTIAAYLYISKSQTKPAATEEADSIPDGDRVFTLTELQEFDATDPTKPVYLAVKGVVFDVTRRREMYAPGRGYSVFAGRDASKAMGMMSLKAEDCIADYSGLDEKQMKVLDDWLAYYRKRYAVMGSVATDDGNGAANESAGIGIDGGNGAANESEEAGKGGRSEDTGDQSEDAVENVSSQAMG